MHRSDNSVNHDDIELGVEQMPNTQKPNLSQKDILASDSDSVSSRANNTTAI